MVRLHLTGPGQALVTILPRPTQGRLRAALRTLTEPDLAGLQKGLSALLGAVD